LNESEFRRMLDKLRSVPASIIGEILQSQHDTWLSKVEKDAIVQFWGSLDFFERLDKIEEGLNLGTYV